MSSSKDLKMSAPTSAQKPVETRSLYGLDFELLQKLNMENLLPKEQPKETMQEEKDFETLRRENQIVDSKHASKLKSACQYYTNTYYD